MPERFATIIKDNEGREVVSSIAIIEGPAPEPRTGNAKVVKAAPNLKVGMVKGGPVDAVGGFGFPEGTPSVAKTEPKAEKAA